MRAAAGALALAGTLAAGGCASTSETLLSAQFEHQALTDSLTIDHPIGQFSGPGDFGSARVVPGPAGTSGNWLQLTQAQKLAPPARIRGVVAAQRFDGHYLFTMRIVIPSGSGASVSFQSGAPPNPTSFVTVPLNTGYVYSQDGTAIGRYPPDAPFSVAVNLTIGASSSATVTLLGMAHGSVTYTVTPNLSADARNFVAIELDTDPRTARSTFFVNDISMIYNAP
jgi:hypothetical protein